MTMTLYVLSVPRYVLLRVQKERYKILATHSVGEQGRKCLHRTKNLAFLQLKLGDTKCKEEFSPSFATSSSCLIRSFAGTEAMQVNQNSTWAMSSQKS